MIARIYRASSFSETIGYCTRKSVDGRPLASSVLSEGPEGSNEETVLREFGRRVIDAKKVAWPVLRIPIYIRPTESLSREQWRLVAERVRNEMGFENCPWAAYLFNHENGRRGEYLLLVLSRVTFDGRIANDRYRMMKVIRELEPELGLVPVS